MKYHTISHKAARELIWSQRINGQGRMFGVAWKRRTTSRDKKRKKEELEVVYGRFGVRKHLKEPGRGNGRGPGNAAYDRAGKNLFCFYVMVRKNNTKRHGKLGYRSIPFEKIKWLKLDGRIYKVGKPPRPQH